MASSWLYSSSFLGFFHRCRQILILSPARHNRLLQNHCLLLIYYLPAISWDVMLVLRLKQRQQVM
jgi:hypothetical protein